MLVRQSALCLSVDRLHQLDKKDPPTFVTVGSNASVTIFSLSKTGDLEHVKALTRTSDNVLAVKTVFNSESKTAIVLFSTANARLNYFQL